MKTELKEISKSDWPRERLLKKGPEALANEELLSIILRTGTKGESVRNLSMKILNSCKSVADLKNLTVNKLKTIKGLGNVKSVTLLASLELGRRVYENKELPRNLKLYSSIDCYRYFSKYIANEVQENFLVIFMDVKSRYISHKILFTGTINSSVVAPREVFKHALLENASAVVLLHNHPSGDVHPSKADDSVTMSMAEVGVVMNIKVVDHIIVSPSGYYSYLEEGRLKYAED